MKKEQLKELGIPSVEKLRSAIEQGDKSKALTLLNGIIQDRGRYREWFMGWIDLLFTRLAEKAGEEEVHKAVRDYYYLRPARADYTKLPLEEIVKSRASGWTDFHVVPIQIEEDDEKFTLTIPCPTGGGLRSKAEYGKTKQPHSWSYNEVGFNYYCTHCLVFFQEIPIEQFGYPIFVNVPVSKPTKGTCIQYIYKDPKFVPEEVYKRIGKEKKTAKGKAAKG